MVRMNDHTHIFITDPLQASLISTPEMEAIPAEVRLAILHAIPDIPTLFNLIRASPTYYATFALAREEILSSVILHELEDNKDLNLFKPMEYMVLYMHSWKYSFEEIAATINHCVEQKAPLKLSAKQRALLRSVDFAQSGRCVRNGPHHQGCTGECHERLDRQYEVFVHRTQGRWACWVNLMRCKGSEGFYVAQGAVPRSEQYRYRPPPPIVCGGFSQVARRGMETRSMRRF